MNLNQKIQKIKKKHKDHLTLLSQSKFGSKNHLLWVVKQAYRQTLDNCCNDESYKRLDYNESYELGENLAKYWYYNKK
jgi:hypothetical protein